jgi:hypothetical protein
MAPLMQHHLEAMLPRGMRMIWKHQLPHVRHLLVTRGHLLPAEIYARLLSCIMV